MPDPNTTLANTLFTELTELSGITLPIIDPAAEHLAQPVTGEGPLYDPIVDLNETDLTERVVGGCGLFDGLMKTVSQHLQQEYERNRLTGKEYAEVYLGSMQSAMGTAMQFLLAKDQSYWQAVVSQRQARVAEIQAVTERANLDLAKTRLTASLGEIQQMNANFAKTKLELAGLTNQIELSDAEVAKVTAETTDLLPAQVASVTAETAIKGYQLSAVLPAQVANLQSEGAKIDYEVASLMPQAVAKATKEIEALTTEILRVEADTSRVTAQKDQVLYETANILPTQKLAIEGDNALKTYQLTYTFPAQLAGITADTAGKVYTNDFLLPANLANVREQTEAHRAKTLDTRTDGATVAGQLGVQKDLQQEQITSYQRDAETKIAKMILDTWITQKSMDEGLIAPTSLNDASINTVMGNLRTNLGI